ncbi:hypothetical protein ACNRBS_22545 [Ralstonia pseudosolanacearum]|uniref:hypothetical protein n=1 Tax=Ralstonia pseudosolanacearum TaxID=1310165 RepID=UPI003AAC1965
MEERQEVDKQKFLDILIETFGSEPMANPGPLQEAFQEYYRDVLTGDAGEADGDEEV